MTGSWTASRSGSPEAVPYADLGDPQTLDLYLYARDNPVTDADADGHSPLDWIWKQTGHMISQVGLAFHLWGGAGAVIFAVTVYDTTPTVAGAAATGTLTGGALASGGAAAIPDAVFPPVLMAEDAGLAYWDGREFYQLGEAYGWWNGPVVLPAQSNPPGGQTEQPSVPYPADPSTPPGPGWEWRGKGPPGSSEGSWYDPSTGESLHPDLQHGDPVGPHWDYISPSGQRFRIFPDGRIAPK